MNSPRAAPSAEFCFVLLRCPYIYRHIKGQLGELQKDLWPLHPLFTAHTNLQSVIDLLAGSLFDLWTQTEHESIAKICGKSLSMNYKVGTICKNIFPDCNLHQEKSSSLLLLSRSIEPGLYHWIIWSDLFVMGPVSGTNLEACSDPTPHCSPVSTLFCVTSKGAAVVLFGAHVAGGMLS